MSLSEGDVLVRLIPYLIEQNLLRECIEAFENARQLFHESLAMRRRLGDLVGIASVLRGLAGLELSHNPELAREYVEESLTIFSILGYEWEMINGLRIAIALGDKYDLRTIKRKQELASILNKPHIISRLDDQSIAEIEAEGILRRDEDHHWSI